MYDFGKWVNLPVQPNVKTGKKMIRNEETIKNTHNFRSTHMLHDQNKL